MLAPFIQDSARIWTRGDMSGLLPRERGRVLLDHLDRARGRGCALTEATAVQSLVRRERGVLATGCGHEPRLPLRKQSAVPEQEPGEEIDARVRSRDPVCLAEVRRLGIPADTEELRRPGAIAWPAQRGAGAGLMALTAGPSLPSRKSERAYAGSAGARATRPRRRDVHGQRARPARVAADYDRVISV
jgi:hypothetical protein